MARVDRQLVAVFDSAGDGIDVGEIESWINALGVHVQSNCNDVAIAGALAVAEQAALDPVGPGHQAELAGGDPGAAVVVGVERDYHRLAVGNHSPEQFDLVGVDVGASRIRPWREG